jgi:hypothetical protein
VTTDPFWGALIKETNLLAGHDEQGRFFGILEGGRGLVEAILATFAVSLFAWSMSSGDTGTTESMRLVILMYVVILMVMTPIVYMSLGEIEHEGGEGIAVILIVVLTVGLLTFAVRGLYWGTLESCNVSNETKGLAIGVISLIGYSPEIYVPLVNGYLVEQYPGRFGYGLFYGSVALVGLVGGAAAFQLMRISAEHR